MAREKEKYYPEPRARRKIWQSLNGEWQFKFGDGGAYDLKILVPYAYQSAASGIGDHSRREILWYKRNFELTEETQKCKTVYLNFLAADYECTVYINGQFALYHEGGYGSFGCDIRPYIKDGKAQEIEIRVYDPYTKTYPRGKQSWSETPSGCFYYATSGIWQSVWLSGARGDYIKSVRFETDIEKTQACAYVETINREADEITAIVKTPHGGEKRFSCTAGENGRFELSMAFEKPCCFADIHLWTAAFPKLYETTLQLRKQGEVLDEIETYFAFRKVGTENGRVYINDEAEELRMVLNQGYFEGYGLTAPSPESYKNDILLAKKMGFNGMRIHQKAEDPWLYYYADTLGMYLWAETPSAYEFTPETTRSLFDLQQQIVKLVYNSPSVIAYVPFNESWGVKEILHDKRQQSLAKAAYFLIKSLDDTRLVITNDGWETLGITDLIGIHDYSKYGDEFAEKFGSMSESLVPAGRRVMVQGERFAGQPIILSEFGGVALATDGGWGYNGAESGEEAFMARLERLFKNMAACDFCGWCYTQLTDVEQETNGLLNAAHEPKFDISKVRGIIEKYGKKFY